MARVARVAPAPACGTQVSPGDFSTRTNMNHRKEYEGWIDDAAVGTLESRLERELLAHAGECDACREAYQHAREVAALIDRGMQSLVAGEPSPHLAARLRGRIAEERPAPHFAWLTWAPVAAGLLAATALAVLWIVLAPGRTNLPPKSIRPSAAVASTIPPVAHAPAEPARGPAERDRSYLTTGQRHSSPQLVAQRRRGIQRTYSPAEPEVLVPPGQLEAVMQLAADIRSGRIDGKQLVAEQANEQAEVQKPIDIQRMEIKPIEIPLVASPADAAAETPAGESSPH